MIKRIVFIMLAMLLVQPIVAQRRSSAYNLINSRNNMGRTPSTGSNNSAGTSTNNTGSSSTKTQKIQFYNTWEYIPNFDSFYVAGYNMKEENPVLQISGNTITVTGAAADIFGNENITTRIYTYQKTENGNDVYEWKKNSLIKYRIIINKQRTSFDLISIAGGTPSYTVNYVSDLKLRNKIIAENKDKAREGTPYIYDPGITNPPINQSGTNSSQYDRYRDDNGKWSDRKYDKVTRENCNLCKGSGVSPYSQSSVSGRTVYTNQSGDRCPYCGSYSYHFHDRCPSCSRN